MQPLSLRAKGFAVFQAAMVIVTWFAWPILWAYFGIFVMLMSVNGGLIVALLTMKRWQKRIKEELDARQLEYREFGFRLLWVSFLASCGTQVLVAFGIPHSVHVDRVRSFCRCRSRDCGGRLAGSYRLKKGIAEPAPAADADQRHAGCWRTRRAAFRRCRPVALGQR